MNHIEEHILELYVLGSKKVEEKRAEIEAHLKECAGCSALVEEMRSFYKDADVEFKTLQQSEASEKKALAQSRPHVTRRQQDFSTPMSSIHSTPVGRLRYFVIKHPVVAGSGVFAFGAVAVMALSLLLSSPIKDTNPAYKNYNVAQGRLEILNKNNEKLWELPSPNLQEEIDAEVQYDCKKTIVADLDGDGRNEVLTSLQVGAGSARPTCLKVFDANQKLKFQKCFNEHFDYLSRTYYGPQFNANTMTLDDLGAGRPQIFLIATNYGRSPCFLVRLDNQGNEVGKYWHFGNLGRILSFDLDKNGKKEVILGGTNDTQDSTHEEFPMILVLDPSRIVGNAKSTSAPGFRFPYSNAELYYIRLPLSDMNIAMKSNAAVERIDTSRGDALSFFLRGGPIRMSPEAGEIQFEYLFACDMSVREVKSGNATDRIHDLMVQKGTLTGRVDKAYLENLKNGVRYWDGKEWRKEVVRVKHENQLTMTNGQ